MRKISMVVAAAMLALCLLNACSDDDPAGGGGPTSTTAGEGAGSVADGGQAEGEDDAVAPPATPGEVRPLDRWAAEFCSGFNTWVGALQTSTEEIDTSVSPTDYPAQQRTLVAFFEGQAAAATAMVERIEAGSVPDIEGGSALVEDLVELFSGVLEAAEGAGAALAALDPAAASFEVDGQEIVTSYQEALGSAGERFTRLAEEYPELAEETSFEEECLT